MAKSYQLTVISKVQPKIFRQEQCTSDDIEVHFNTEPDGTRIPTVASLLGADIFVQKKWNNKNLSVVHIKEIS